MTRLLAGLMPFFAMCSALAEEVKDAPPPDHTNVVGIVLFFGIFIALCVGFFGYMWWQHKNNNEE